MGLLLLLLAFGPLQSFSQKLISGKVISAKDQTPIPGVSIVVKGTQAGTSSNTEGSFAINAKKAMCYYLVELILKQQKWKWAKLQVILLALN